MCFGKVQKSVIEDELKFYHTDNNDESAFMWSYQGCTFSVFYAKYKRDWIFKN